MIFYNQEIEAPAEAEETPVEEAPEETPEGEEEESED